MSDIRVFTVDDCDATRRLMVYMINQQPGLTVVGEASGGAEALMAFETDRPDVVTLDVQMPEMDGVATLRSIRERFGALPVVMCSSVTSEGAQATIEALLAGANDFVCKIPPANSDVHRARYLQEELCAKIRAVHARSVGTPVEIPHDTSDAFCLDPKEVSETACTPQILVIGATTGGPAALAELLRRMPAVFPVPICIVQPMPPKFTALLAETLGRRLGRHVVEAEDGVELKHGTCYLAPGGRHLHVHRETDGRIRASLSDRPELHNCRPAIDELFASAAQEFPRACLGVLLTGMGNDGLYGARRIRAAGGSLLVQDCESSVVWGMARRVAEEGLADGVFPLSQLAEEILAYVSGREAAVRTPQICGDIVS